jgi:hypothetical protein
MARGGMTRHLARQGGGDDFDLTGTGNEPKGGDHSSCVVFSLSLSLWLDIHVTASSPCFAPIPRNSFSL